MIDPETGLEISDTNGSHPDVTLQELLEAGQFMKPSYKSQTHKTLQSLTTDHQRIN